jgi:hypothetical protein
MKAALIGFGVAEILLHIMLLIQLPDVPHGMHFPPGFGRAAFLRQMPRRLQIQLPRILHQS